MKSTTASIRPRRSLPMPLWLQGIVELFLTAIFSAAIFALMFIAIWYTNGFPSASLSSSVAMSGNIWLLVHGVPLHLNIPAHGLVTAISGTTSFIPLGFTLFPFLLCFRAGRRLARASYEGEFWVPLLGGLVAYATFSAALSFYARSSVAATSLIAATLIPCIVAGLGIISGGLFESRSLTRMIGLDAAETVRKYSQYSRWAGSYLWALLRSVIVATLAFIAGGALLMSLTIFAHWTNILDVYQVLHAGAVGDTALTLLQLGVAPNLLVYGLGFASGAGFYLGEDSLVSWSGAHTGALPLFPILGAVPHLQAPLAYGVVLIPVVAGITAGWWFFREGEDHLDEWISLKLKFRPLSWILSHITFSLFLGLLSGILMIGLGWAASGSLGLGKFTRLGVDPLFFGICSAVWIAWGSLVGSLLGRMFEKDAKGDLERVSDSMTPSVISAEKKKQESARSFFKKRASSRADASETEREGDSAESERTEDFSALISLASKDELLSLDQLDSQSVEAEVEGAEEEAETETPADSVAEERPWWEKHTLIREPQKNVAEQTPQSQEKDEVAQQANPDQATEAVPGKPSSDTGSSSTVSKGPRLSRGRVIRRPKAQKKETTDN